MSREERRQQMDRTVVEAIRARLVRIKIAATKKHVQGLQANWVEAQILAAKRKEGQ